MCDSWQCHSPNKCCGIKEDVRVSGRLFGWVAPECYPLISQFTRSLSANFSSQCKSHFDKVTVGYRANKCPNFRVTLKFVTMFTKTCHCIPPWQTILQSHNTALLLQGHIIFSCRFPNGFLASSVRNSILYKLTLIISNMHATCTATLIFLYKIHEFGGSLIMKLLIMLLVQTFCL